MSAKDQLQEVTTEMISTVTKMPANEQRRVLTEVRAKLADDSLCPCGPAFLTSPCHAWMLPNNDHQCAPQEAAPTHVPALEGQHRVGPTPEVTPAESLQRMLNAPPIMNAPNPTTRRALKSTKRVHLRLTRNNVPGTVTTITRTQPLYSPPTATKMTPIGRSPWLQKCPHKRTTQISLNHTANPNTPQLLPVCTTTTSSANKLYIYLPTMCGTTQTPILHKETYGQRKKQMPQI